MHIKLIRYLTVLGIGMLSINLSFAKDALVLTQVMDDVFAIVGPMGNRTAENK